MRGMCLAHSDNVPAQILARETRRMRFAYLCPRTLETNPYKMCPLSYSHARGGNTQTDAPVRSLRAALVKFAELAPLTKSSKCRVFVTSLIQPLVSIVQRTEDESLQVCVCVWVCLWVGGWEARGYVCGCACMWWVGGEGGRGMLPKCSLNLPNSVSE